MVQLLTQDIVKLWKILNLKSHKNAYPSIPGRSSTSASFFFFFITGQDLAIFILERAEFLPFNCREEENWIQIRITFVQKD